MTATPLVFLWDSDSDGKRHGGDLMLAGLEQARTKGHIELVVLKCWCDFTATHSEGSKEFVRGRQAVFFIHASEECGCGGPLVSGEDAATKLVDKQANIGLRLRGLDARVSVLLYSGGTRPALPQVDRGDWVSEDGVAARSLQRVPGLDLWIAALFEGMEGGADLARRFAEIPIPFSQLSALIHDLDNRIAPLRVDLDLLGEIGDELEEKTFTEIMTAALGSHESGDSCTRGSGNDGYLFGIRRGRSLADLISMTVQGDDEHLGLAKLIEQFPEAKRAELAPPGELCGGEADQCGSLELLVQRFKLRMESLRDIASGRPPDRTAVLERLEAVGTWLAAFSNYLRRIRNAMPSEPAT